MPMAFLLISMLSLDLSLVVFFSPVVMLGLTHARLCWDKTRIGMAVNRSHIELPFGRFTDVALGILRKMIQRL